MMTVDNHPATPPVSRRTHINKRARREASVGWLFVLPALLIYAVFVLVPLLLSILYSFNRWNGVGPMTWVGLKNYVTPPALSPWRIEQSKWRSWSSAPKR